MPASSKRGLVAPQNTFLEDIIRRTNQYEPNCLFLLASARIWDWPIVFASLGFCASTGFRRAEVMNCSCLCTFMQSDDANEDVLRDMRDTLEAQKQGKFEIKAQTKSGGKAMWFGIHTVPIKNDHDETVLFLLTFKDLTALRKSGGPLQNRPGDGGIAKFNNFVNKVTKIRRSAEMNNVDIIGPSAEANQRITEAHKIFNLNPDILPKYHHEKPKTPKGIILHYSTAKMCWDWFILLLTFYTAIIVPYNEAFLDRGRHVAWLYSNSVIDLIFVTDIFLNFRTTFVGPGGAVISDSNLIRMNYVRSWFVVDLVSCLPYDLMNFMVPSSGGFGEEGISSVFSSCKVIRLLRLGRVARKLDHYIEYGGAMLVLLVFSFGLSGHWFACGWYVIGWRELLSPNGTVREYNWLAALGRSLNSEFYVNPNGTIAGGPSIRECYIASLYFTMTSLTSVGFGNISANTEGEQIFCIVMLIFGALLYATIFGNVTTIIQQMYADTNRYHDMLNSVREFLKLYEIPDNLSDRIMDYIVSTWSMSKGIDRDKVLNYCPKDMKADICVHLNRKVFNDHSAFGLASDSCLRAIAIEFTNTHTAPGDMICHKGETVDTLYFVVAGSLEVIQDEEVVAILCKGDAFGDVFWRDHVVGHSECHVRALTYCDLHTVKGEALQRVLGLHQSFADSFALKMELTFNIRKRVKSKTIAEVKREREVEHDQLSDLNRFSEEDKEIVLEAAKMFKSRLYSRNFSYSRTEDSTAEESLAPAKTRSRHSTNEGHQTNMKYRPKRTVKVSTNSEIHHIDSNPTRAMIQTSTLDVCARPAYLVIDTDSVMECVNNLRTETRGKFDSMNDRMTKMEEKLSQIVTLLRTQTSNVNSQNKNRNNNKLDDGGSATNSNVSISIPEDSNVENQIATPLRSIDYDVEARRRYWHARTAPHLENLRLPSFKLPHNPFSRHFHR